MNISSSKKNDKRLNNLKYLADEMVQILLEKQRKEAEEKMNEESVFYDIDIKSHKHRSQVVFYNRNHHKMLTNFSLNKPNEENPKSNKSIMRRKNKQITAQNHIDYVKSKISFRLNMKKNENNNVNDNNVIDEEKNLEGNKSKGNLDFGEDKVSEKDEEKEEENFEEEKMSEEDNINPEEDYLEYESGELQDERGSIDNYEIFYMDPARINTKEREELSTKNDGEQLINNEFKQITPNYKNNKGRYLFEKGIKMQNLKNNKIKKAQEIIENKNKGLFNIKNFLTKKNKKNKNDKTNSNAKTKENHVPLQYKAGELYRYHLTQIEINKRNNIIKKRMKEKEEMKQAKKDRNKIKKISKKSWNDFVKKENEWKKNNIMNREESLKNKYKQKIYDRPKINRSSIIMLEQKNEKEKEKNKFNINIKTRNNFNIYTKLYKDKEIYDNKLKLRIHNSTPTFVPKIHRNKTQKFHKVLTDINFTKNENKISKTMNNKQRINNDNSKKNINKRNISYDNKNKLKKKEITLKNERFSPKLISSISTKTLKHSKININNKRNMNTKKMIVYELDISDSNFNKKISKPAINKSDINSLIEKLGNKASQKLTQNKINFIRNNSIKKDNLKNEMKNNTEIVDKKVITPSKENNNDDDNDNIEKNKRKTRKRNLELNDDRKFLYNLNIRDNTSNSLNQFVVLTSKKYIDFFK